MEWEEIERKTGGDVADTLPGRALLPMPPVLFCHGGAPTHAHARWLETTSWITWLCYCKHVLTR
jgi:hypothetical protein